MTKTRDSHEGQHPAVTASPRVFSGIQPTSDSFHLGNYLGALRHWVALQQTHDPIYCVVNQHALTVDPSPADLHRRTRASLAQLVALGVDPDRSVLFVQSDVPEHAQLTWVLECLTGFGEASRMTQFKDKSAKGGADRSSVGLFTYPMLMAADILLYQTHVVPVGEDQRQHLELTRDLAARFNAKYGETFVVPEPHIVKETGRIVDLQNPTGKMSKSTATENSLVNVLDTPKQMSKKIKSAMTDSIGVVSFDPDNQPGVANLLTILGSITDRDPESLVADYAGKGYGALKVDTADAVVAVFEPIGNRTRELLDDPAELDKIMDRGAERARVIAADTLAKVYRAIGFDGRDAGRPAVSSRE
ncbi:tryptophanyl-tRNA synthetase [Antricoccus suffuscus]|uniref:Tryptophan--tRNA ligase n=1 Tax=Antricoccus suffuscus TaxID=1629062 RepID=A0A2T0ZFT6_9ACTN|nr:tryptophan--tRNA ligase [Antricoccus suffuscus]PRZ35229.1 tryptophanyl-tRNA synthetase [Antricoccus suffuscus]